VADDVGVKEGGIGLLQAADETSQHLILSRRIRYVVRALELDSDRVIVAARPTGVPGCTSVPGTIAERDVLSDIASPVDQHMACDAQVADLAEIGMFVGVEAVRKQPIDIATAELAGR
jgi:hypothetical protein